MRKIELTQEQKAHIRIWVDALRSGNYQQGNGRLAYQEILNLRDPSSLVSGVKYCCLGVACEVAIANGVKVVRKEYHRPHSGLIQFEYGGHADHLPPSVQDWLGVIDHDPQVFVYMDEDRGAVPESLAALNDGEVQDISHALSFVEIADLIEASYLTEGQGADEQVH